MDNTVTFQQFNDDKNALKKNIKKLFDEFMGKYEHSIKDVDLSFSSRGTWANNDSIADFEINLEIRI